MDATDIALIRSSFASVVPIADTAAGLFYNRLFELDEDLRPLFHFDIERQGRLLMKMISTAVDNLDDLGNLVPVVQKLGERHKIYGVEPAHYDTVGAHCFGPWRRVSENITLRIWNVPGPEGMACFQT